MWKQLIVVFSLAALSGCATIVEGSDQNIAIDTSPQGAVCEVKRDGVTIGSTVTPGTVNISKSKDPIGVVCNKKGYRTATSGADSDFEGMTLGNILLGGVVGVAIDAGSGAMNEYPDKVVLTLQKL